MHGIAVDDARDADAPDASMEHMPASDSLHLPVYAPKHPGIARRLRDAILKPLFVILTTQSVIVAVLVCLAAVVTAQHASQIISEKFSAINAALRRMTP